MIKLKTPTLLSALLLTSLSLSGFSASPIPDLPSEFRAKTAATVTVLEFSAPWCASCQKLKPHVDKLLTEVGPKLRVVHLNIEKAETQKYLQQFDLASVPTFVLFDSKGKALEKIERDITPTEFRGLVMKRIQSK